MEPFSLPKAPENESLSDAVRASLGMLDVADDLITMPVSPQSGLLLWEKRILQCS